MPRVPSNATKIARGYGQGIGADYKAFVTAAEFPGRGTAEVIPDWKTGRGVECLSQGEALWYYVLRWDDDNADIREQFPLWDADKTNAETKAIAKELGYRHPGKTADHIMTTDFLVTERGGKYRAYSVKVSRSAVTRREKEKLQIEAAYWAMRNVPFTMLYKEDVDVTLSTNIRLVTRYYDPAPVFHDDAARIKHMIATKQYEADLSAQIVDVPYLTKIELANKGLLEEKDPDEDVIMATEEGVIFYDRTFTG